MPVRSISSPILRGLLARQFHSSRALYETHYETLQIPTNASPAEIKKSFYTLSKSHHPDRNPNDPTASSRFVKISDAYAILGNTEKRQKYDRETLPRSQPSNPVPRGSYSSSGPAGGRPASGLSRRRTHFQGPPPSFYRSGGWGAHSAKRGAAAEETANNARAQTNHHNETGQTGEAGGMGPGQHPFGDASEVPHFDREGHFRTHERQEKRRRRTTNGESRGHIELPPGGFAMFALIGGIVSLGVILPSFMFERFTRKGKEQKA